MRHVGYSQDERELERVSAEAWGQYLVRNRSVVVDIFAGQLKSTLRCLTCGRIATKFDPFVRR